MDGLSKDLKAEKLQALEQQFPELFSEGKLDIEKLKQSLEDEYIAGDERYRLEWAGKHRVFEEIAKRSSATLTPDKERSVDFDDSQNVFIEGENLEVLRTLQKAYHGKVKMIYIDPPYNTGKDFVYNDNFRDTIEEYDEEAGNVDEEGNLAKAYTMNSKDSGQYHSNWLNMMYPRLYLARNLLREDGVIFVSIDDNEVHNLRMMMNEIFGEENFEGHIHWRRRHNQPNDPNKLIALVAEHILVFAKNSESLKKVGVGKLDLTGDFSNPDNDKRGDWNSKPWKVGSNQSGSEYKIQLPNGKFAVEQWMGDETTYNRLLSEDRIYFPNNGAGLPRKKIFKSEREKEGQVATNWFPHDLFGHNQMGSSECADLFEGEKNIFDNPKPVKLLKKIIQLGNLVEDDVVLDFFSGSGSTAHAVMQQNSEDGGNRKYICVQIPEKTPEKSEARKAGYNTISEIAIERIKRAAKKVEEEHPEYEGDLGVRVYKQTDSHFPAWRAQSFENDAVLQSNLQDFANAKAHGGSHDRTVELLLKLGYDLTTPVEEKDGYYVAAKGEVALVVDEKSAVDLDAVLKTKPRVVVVLEDVFKTDDAKINFALACKEQDVTFQTV